MVGVIMPPVTTAAPTISARIHSLNRPNLVSIGTIVWLSSELMFFAGLFGNFGHQAYHRLFVVWLNNEALELAKNGRELMAYADLPEL